jgi:hypothetical protein
LQHAGPHGFGDRHRRRRSRRDQDEANKFLRAARGNDLRNLAAHGMAGQHIAAETKPARDFHGIIRHRRKIVASVSRN